MPSSAKGVVGFVQHVAAAYLSNECQTSITNDIIFVAATAFVWMGVEYLNIISM